MNLESIKKEFNLELSLILNEDLKNLIIKTLEQAPEYFWKIPASSTGKYHPNYALGEGGLVRHTKACVRIANELFRNNTVQNFTPKEKELIVASLILHDTVKNGFNGGIYTVTEHPLLVKQLFAQTKVNEKEEEYCNKLIPLIEKHMGEWTFDRKTKTNVLIEPKSKLERFVHLCDYLASRKCLEVNFNVVG